MTFKLPIPYHCKHGIRDNCVECSGLPIARRCIICLQPAKEVKRFPTKCVITTDQVHIVPFEGYGARCEECGEEPFGVKVGDDTVCTSDGGHLMYNYPFRCEACGSGVKVADVGVGGKCSRTYTGEHILPFRKSEVVAVPPLPSVDYADSSRRLIEVAGKRDKRQKRRNFNKYYRL